MIDCRICGEYATFPLEYPPEYGGPWFRCVECGSDSSANAEPYIYDDSYLAHELSDGVDREQDMASNLDWFGHYAKPTTFLDVGCLSGAALRGMAARGWATHGFDVIEAARTASPPGRHIDIAPKFQADRAYGAVLCREVIEHVPDWMDLLIQLARATEAGGLLQIQTPRPGPLHRTPYQRSHLQIFSPSALGGRVGDLGFATLDYREWPLGFAFLARKS